MFRQDRTNPSTAVSNWRGRHDTPKAWPNTAVSTWLNGGLFGGGAAGAMYWTMFGDGGGTITKWSFADDSRTTLVATLDYPTWGGGGCSNSGVAGYMIGGANGPQNTYVQKLEYAADTASTLGSPTAYFAATYDDRAMSNSGVAGYSGGGCCHTNLYHKVNFASEAISTLTATMSTQRDAGACMSDSGTAGYTGGGPSSPVSAVVDKLTFSTETSAALGTGLSEVRSYMQSMSNTGVFGYLTAGKISNAESPYPGGWRSDCNKFAFPSDTRTVVGSGFLSVPISGGGGGSNSGVAGYVGGGQSINVLQTFIDKFEFPSDTRSALSEGLAQTGNTPAYFSNELSLA